MGPDADDRKERIKKYDGRAENWRKFEANIRAWMRTKHFEISKCLFPLHNASRQQQPTSALADTSDDEAPSTTPRENENLQQFPTPTTVTEAREMIASLRKNAGANHARFDDEFDNVKLLELIHQNVESNVQDLFEAESSIHDCEDGWAAWQLLRLTAHGEMSTRATQIRKMIREKEWNPKSATIADFVTEMNILVKQLEGCGENSSQQARVDCLSQAMPDGNAAWETFRNHHLLDAINTTKIPDYNKFCGDLIQYVEAVAKPTSRTATKHLQHTHRQAMITQAEKDDDDIGYWRGKGRGKGKGKGSSRGRGDKSSHTCYT